MKMLVGLIAIAWFLCAVTGAVLAMNRGNSGFIGFLAGGLLGVFGLVMILTFERNPMPSEAWCDSCAKIIRKEAVLCPYCKTPRTGVPSLRTDGGKWAASKD
jgi:hypothetical protein